MLASQPFNTNYSSGSDRAWHGMGGGGRGSGEGVHNGGEEGCVSEGRQV